MNINEPRSRLSRRRQKPSTRRQAPEARALPVSINDVSSSIWDLTEVKSYTIDAVEDILKQRSVPKSQICSPSLEITIPAIEAMRYSPLRREIAALIASTMDRKNADTAHPSFLNILQQLTEDEVNILAAFPGNGRVLPMAHLWMSVTKEHSEILHRNIVPASIARLCTKKSRIPMYIDNLLRLQLLHEPEGLKVGDARIYSSLLRQDFCTHLLDSPKIRKNTSLEKHTIAVSDVGETFRRVCFV